MVALTCYGGEPSKGSIALYNIAFSFILVCGVDADRAGRQLGSSYDYRAFLFLLWPFILPVYLFKTRRWHGLALALGIVVLSEVPSVASVITYLWLAASGT